MTAMAARTMGYRVRVLDPDPACPAHQVADSVIVGKWDDAAAAAALAEGCAAVTLEIEQIAVASLEAAEQFAPVRPSPRMVGVIQDRIAQKEWLKARGFPVGDYRAVRSEQELASAVKELGGRVFLKAARGGYDGRSQVRIGFDASASASEVANAWAALGGRPAVAEQALELAMELSVMVARSPRGETKVFPPAANHHERQILDWSVLPMMVPAAVKRDPTDITEQASEIALGIAKGFELEGLLAIEMFLTADGKLLVNELAPRPHNSYHESERACVTSQFEQLVRAVCNLPLGEVDVITPAAIANLLGELWLDEKGNAVEPQFDAALTVPGVRLHLYEKQQARPGRKMGHLSATAVTPGEAVQSVLSAKDKL
jgi:5-(carboxyamino)imidazole ribonucleotide synthase